MAAIKSKSVVVLYGATLPDVGEEPGKVKSDEILAYETKVPDQGGLVLLLDRTVREMTAEEFKNAKKASAK